MSRSKKNLVFYSYFHLLCPYKVSKIADIISTNVLIKTTKSDYYVIYIYVAHLYTTIHTNVCIKVRLILDPKEIIKLTYKLCMYVLIKLSFHEHIESYWLNLKQSNICKLRTLPPPLKFLCLAVISKGINLLLWQ